MTTLTSIREQVERRTALLARTKQNPALMTTPADDGTLDVFTRQGAAEIAVKTGRVEAVATIPLAAGQSGYDVPLTVFRVQRATLTYDLGEGVRTYDLPHQDGARVRAEAADGFGGSPARFGLHGGRLFVSPVPITNGTLRLYYLAGSMIGEAGPSDTDETAGDVEAEMPEELERMLVDYVVSEWLREIGEHQAADPIRSRYLSDLDDMRGNPRVPRTTRPPYRPVM